MSIREYVAIGVTAAGLVSAAVCWNNVERCQSSMDSPKFEEARNVAALDAKVFPRIHGRVQSAAPFLSDSDLRALEPQFARRNDLIIANRPVLQEYHSIGNSLRNYGLGTIVSTLVAGLGFAGYLGARRTEKRMNLFAV